MLHARPPQCQRDDPVLTDDDQSPLFSPLENLTTGKRNQASYFMFTFDKFRYSISKAGSKPVLFLWNV